MRNSVATGESVADMQVLVKGTHDAFFLFSADPTAPATGQLGPVNEIGLYSTQFKFDFNQSKRIQIMQYFVLIEFSPRCSNWCRC